MQLRSIQFRPTSVQNRVHSRQTELNWTADLPNSVRSQICASVPFINNNADILVTSRQGGLILIYGFPLPLLFHDHRSLSVPIHASLPSTNSLGFLALLSTSCRFPLPLSFSPSSHLYPPPSLPFHPSFYLLFPFPFLRTLTTTPFSIVRTNIAVCKAT